MSAQARLRRGLFELLYKNRLLYWFASTIPFAGQWRVWQRLVLPRLRRTTVMFIGLGGLSVSIFGLTLINALAENPAHVPDSSKPLLLLLILLVVLGVFLLSGFTPASLTHMAAISELLPGKRGTVMGLYSVVMGVGQLIGASLGGLCTDLGGFYGLMGFSVALGLISLGSVLYIRVHGHNLIKSQSRYRWSSSGKLPYHAYSGKLLTLHYGQEP